ncbi:hypothetical protein NE237_002151 [Protea cynaroides]|uniref:COP1-interacting protein 7 n=1 Tax=Protea cynaroides TaxID=273540 RepID=A0A9Q0KUP1_9MAGN|nr:hypothetical protein NE237_002151 [Protea cynaroides]
MDSSTRLEYALFQLTPTRTRCDLVVFSGGLREKLASGLVEPFNSHLRCAKEQISKGGYSITLRASNPSDAGWFTKGTLERFVRFVSTPEVLERFVTIEREILQIDSSVQSNELSNPTAAGQAEEGNVRSADGYSKKSTTSSQSKSNSRDSVNVVQEENSKLCLKRLMETRKAVLRKEQAMAYACALVAGFDMDRIDDLLSFAAAFGASRLREACLNFKELCNKKHDDGLWMDELAAMEACPLPELPYLGTSGIILTSDDSNPSPGIMPISLSNGKLDGSVSDSTTVNASSDNNQGQVPPAVKNQVPMPWANQLPPYMYNFQGPVTQQLPPYQGYPIHGMQIFPPYYQGNMHWSPNTDGGHGPVLEPDHHSNHKSSSGRKGRLPNGKGHETLEQDGQTEPGDSTSGSDLDSDLDQELKNSTEQTQLHKRRHKNKSSRMVVIRNINYINPKRREGKNDSEFDDSSSLEDEFIDGDSLRQKVKEAVGSLEKHHKATPHHHKKRGEEKHANFLNGSNVAADQDLENDFDAKTSGGAKNSENWNTFQSLVMRNEEPRANGVEKQCTINVQGEYLEIKSSDQGTPSAFTTVVDLESEKKTKQRPADTDSFLMTERDSGNESRIPMDNFERSENFRPGIKKKDCTNEELLFPHRIGGSERNLQDPLSECIIDSSVLKTQKSEDWFVMNQSKTFADQDATIDHFIFDGDRSLTPHGGGFQIVKSKKDLVDDSFMVQDRSIVDQCDSRWTTDIIMVSDLAVAVPHENGSTDPSRDKVALTYEPDDLCMVLERGSGVESVAAPWTPEIDYGRDISLAESEKKSSSVEKNDNADDKLASNGKSTGSKNSKDAQTKISGRETNSKSLRGSLVKSKSENMSRIKKSSTGARTVVQKSKMEKEEENRKKMEELLIQRQKRIAERSAANGNALAIPRRASLDSKTTITSIKHDKKLSHSTTPETKRLSLPKTALQVQP